MAHSSGGGSGGGSGFSGGSHSGSSSTYSSTRPFVGARRYHYVYGGRHYYFYSSVRPSRRNIIGSIFPLLFAVIFITIGLIFAINSMYPHKLNDRTCIYRNTYLKDNAHCVTNEESLKFTLDEFYEKTGIQVLVYTNTYANYYDYYRVQPTNRSALEEHALDEYYSSARDEGHWLIYYIVGDPSLNQSFEWIGIQGDSTDPVLTERICNIFNEEVTDKLIDGAAFDAALISGFNLIYDDLLVFHFFDTPLIIILVFFGIFYLFLIAAIISTIKQVKQLKNYCDYRDNNKGGKDDFKEVKENDLYKESINPKGYEEEQFKDLDPVDYSLNKSEDKYDEDIEYTSMKSKTKYKDDEDYSLEDKDLK